MHSRIVEEEPMLRWTEIFVVASLEVDATGTKRTRVEDFRRTHIRSLRVELEVSLKFEYLRSSPITFEVLLVAYLCVWLLSSSHCSQVLGLLRYSMPAGFLISLSY
jgi:hypothetical protein